MVVETNDPGGNAIDKQSQLIVIGRGRASEISDDVASVGSREGIYSRIRNAYVRIGDRIGARLMRDSGQTNAQNCGRCEEKRPHHKVLSSKPTAI